MDGLKPKVQFESRWTSSHGGMKFGAGIPLQTALKMGLLRVNHLFPILNFFFSTNKKKKTEVTLFYSALQPLYK